MAALRDLREGRSGLTQSDVATLLGVRAATVSDWERGLARPSPRHARELARLYRVSASEIREASGDLR